MKKLRKLWLRLPRKTRIAVNLLAIFLLGFGVYVFCGCPPFTVEQKFRRAEKANFVGPADILGVYELENFGFSHLVVADNGDGVFFYAFSNLIDPSGNLVYRQKTGNLTVLAAPDYQPYTSREVGAEIPVFLFDEYPEAARAELDFTLSTTLNNVYFEKDYALEATREGNGYFRFIIKVTSLGPETYAVADFSRLCGYSSSWNLQTQPVTVRLYDDQDALILEEEVIIRCVADTAHRELMR